MSPENPLPRRLLITRPAEETPRTVEAATAAGWETLSAPLLSIAPLGWEPPAETDFTALLLTSPQGARHGWPLPEHLAALPVYAVGARTADVARAQGFRVIAEGDTDGTAIVAKAFADGHRRMLHLRGEQGATLLLPPDLRLTVRTVYRAVPASRIPEHAARTLKQGTVFATMLFSPRTAHLFARLVDMAGLDRRALRLVALSNATAAAAGDGWQAIAIAELPSLRSALASAEKLWQKETHG